MNVELLLQELTSISKKYEMISQKTGGYFNIFEITNIWSDEVVICRVIYEILSPEGTHFQGHKYLKTFIDDVLKMDMSEEEIKTAKVFREYRIDNNRRIDLVIQTVNHFIPIEVKIYAGEQENQCFDYAKVAKNSDVYYLTRFGEYPSDYRLMIFTIGDLARGDPDLIRMKLGINGVYLWNYANGRDYSSVTDRDYRDPVKSVGRGITTTEDLENNLEVYRVFRELSFGVSKALRSYGYLAGGIQISVKNNNLLSKQYQRQMQDQTNK